MPSKELVIIQNFFYFYLYSPLFLKKLLNKILFRGSFIRSLLFYKLYTCLRDSNIYYIILIIGDIPVK
jgi:hypothetical protein